MEISLLPECADDPLFNLIPSTFSAHVSHSQTVINLPGKAMRLAMNPFEPNHAFRVGDCAWGIQFHPEYTADIMRSYILNEKEDLMHEGIEIRPVLDSVKETPVVASILRRFNEFVMMRCGRCK